MASVNHSDYDTHPTQQARQPSSALPDTAAYMPSLTMQQDVYLVQGMGIYVVHTYVLCFTCMKLGAIFKPKTNYIFIFILMRFIEASSNFEVSLLSF